ncbi:putative aquaporin [Podospora aff. communis PSN243]|uniref:Aquaporin n=1 Tax=Podospora aff. communis PSN243 TaxID=3040156 RepID=A0AAV9G5M3_9PEZI|nr:putative aquaporin [Podospora aff. communis PSN243]
MSPSRPRFLSFATAASGNNSSSNLTGANNNPKATAGSSALPMLTLPPTLRNNTVAALGEFIGTFLFLFFAFAGTQVANSTVAAGAGTAPNLVVLVYISLAFGVSLTANVWAFYRITGGLFNPSVTLALCLVGGLPLLRSSIVFVAQVLGGIAAAGVVSALFPGEMKVGTALGGGTSVVQGLFIEMFLTAELVFVIIMLAAEKHKSTFLAPLGIGISFFLAELVGVYFTGGSLNFARSFGPAVVNGNFPGYFWIYALGPMLGALVASGFYSVLKYLRWKECNPGQDRDWDDTERMERQPMFKSTGQSNGMESPEDQSVERSGVAEGEGTGRAH